MNNVAQTSPSIKPGWKRVDALGDLADIFEPGVQICAWPRQVDPRIVNYLEHLEAADTFRR